MVKPSPLVLSCLYRLLSLNLPILIRWFAKRFLHPDIVAEYDYVFLWDEDIGVDHFNPKRYLFSCILHMNLLSMALFNNGVSPLCRYLSIVKREGLEISQPALDTNKSEVHHQITARGRRSFVHRRTYKPGDNVTGCDHKSSTPPCTG